MTVLHCRKCGDELGEFFEEGQPGVGMELRQGLYGCDSGCTTVTGVIKCDCGDSWEGWVFGEIWDREDVKAYGLELYSKYRNH